MGHKTWILHDLMYLTHSVAIYSFSPKYEPRASDAQHDPRWTMNYHLHFLHPLLDQCRGSTRVQQPFMGPKAGCG
jgi:hypothetical protein